MSETWTGERSRSSFWRGWHPTSSPPGCCSSSHRRRRDWIKLGVHPPGAALPQAGAHVLGVGVKPSAWTFVFLGATGVFLALLIPRVDINEFSIHHLYRNRLIRCYLGASNVTRMPHPFTGFDPSTTYRWSICCLRRRWPLARSLAPFTW